MHFNFFSFRLINLFILDYSQDYIKIKATKGVATVPYAPWISARDVRLADKQSEGYSLVYLYSVDLKI